jgi:3-deoxy-D-manno-octulosonic-acid transferase
MLSLYNAILLLLRPAAALWATWAGRTASGREEAAERMARRLPEVAPSGLWIHGSSVGEARIVASLAEALRKKIPDRPLALSAFTRTGRAQLPSRPDADAIFYLPLDFSGFADRLLDAMQPSLLTIVETELWPNLLHAASQRGVPVALVNGRISPERMSRYRRFKGLYGPLLAGMTMIGAQSEQEARRFMELGASESSIRVTGNIKYDLPIPTFDEEELRGRLGLPAERAVFVAGSTGPREEALVLDAFELAREASPLLYLVLAPRHPERADEVERLLRERGLSHRRLTRARGRPSSEVDVLLVDGVGHLAALYKLGVAAFVGGSLVPGGGHNMLEPAALGVPVLFGPHTDDFAEPAAMLERAGGGQRISDAQALGRAVAALLRDPERRRSMAGKAEKVLAANRGALNRSVELLLSIPGIS